MKRTFLTFSVFVAVVCCTPVFASDGAGSLTGAAKANGFSKVSEEAKYGASIGTVDGQDYSESGLKFNYFYDVAYVANTSADTYMGFDAYWNWEYDEEGNEAVRIDYLELSAINTNEESVIIPDSVRIEGKTYPVVEVNGNDSFIRALQSGGVKRLTFPATINQIYWNSNYGISIEEAYMLGEAPSASYFYIPKIYVCNRNDLASYISNYKFSYSKILPFGWDFEWITVNVEKTGEFAETYLTQNDYDWGAAQYVKVTGNINDIDLNAIKNLTGLMKLDLSETKITSLPESFMYGRQSLNEVKLPSTLKSIGYAAFSGCNRLESFDLQGITTIGSYVFQGCSSLSYINLTGVESIGESSFANCTLLDGIDLSTVVKLENGAFKNCQSLQSVDLSSATQIGSSTSFYGNDYGCFSGCSKLESVIFGKNLKLIGAGAFSGTAIKKVAVPEGITSINGYVFCNCRNLESVDLPSSVETVATGAFSGCEALTTINMNTGLKNIYESAFYGCRSLEEVSIPATVKSIGRGAFSDTGIITFKCYAVVPPAADSRFIGADMDMTHTYLYVPPFSKDFYRNTEYWSDFYLMRSLEDQVDYILVDRPLTINLEEEDNAVVANNPEIALTAGAVNGGNNSEIGQLTAIGEGTLSAGRITIDSQLGSRYYNSYQYCPTLINYADKMRADNVTVNMWLSSYYSSNEWHFISLPFDVKVSDIIPGDGTYWAIRRYDSAARAAGETLETWVSLTEEDTMTAGQGYIVSTSGKDGDFSYPRLTFSSGNSITKNNIFRSTDVAVALTEYPAVFAHNRSWNLVGNPYPCYFDMHYLNEEFTAPVTVWNGRSYVAYSPVDDNLVLSPYEAFFVQCPLDAKEITFKESGRMHSAEGRTLFKAPAMKSETVSVEDRNVFNFEVRCGEAMDRARIVINEEASMEYELGKDASKFFAEESDGAQIYVKGDAYYSICERPASDGMAELGIKTSKETDCILSLSGRYSADWHVIVTDNETGISIDLTETDYQFTASKGDMSSRFSVSFRIGIQNGIEAIEAEFGKDAVVTVTAINGHTVYRGRVADMKVPAAGIHIISNGKETRKAILK